MDNHFSNSENGPGWEVPFQFRKWFEIYDGKTFSSSENGPDRTIIFCNENGLIYCNDQIHVKLSKKPVFHNRLKYIKIKHYILRDKFHKREVVLQYISTYEKITDILVKPLSKMKSLCT